MYNPHNHHVDQDLERFQHPRSLSVSVLRDNPCSELHLHIFAVASLEYIPQP